MDVLCTINTSVFLLLSLQGAFPSAVHTCPFDHVMKVSLFLTAGESCTDIPTVSGLMNCSTRSQALDHLGHAR